MNDRDPQSSEDVLRALTGSVKPVGGIDIDPIYTGFRLVVIARNIHPAGPKEKPHKPTTDLAKLIIPLRESPTLFSPRRIQRPPGSKVLAFVEFFCSKKTYSKVFEPIIADLYEEYFETLDKQRYWKARWIRIRYTGAFFSAIGLHLSLATVKKIVDLWKVIG